MASILDRYGIKEVADVTFYQIDESGKPGAPVLFLDTLKVSTIEQTAEQTEARGGKGNPPLIIWDYGKEINVTLEDALFSAKSMAIMFGNKDGEIKTNLTTIKKTIQFTAIATGSDIVAAYPTHTGTGETAKLTYEINGKTYEIPAPTSGSTYLVYDAAGEAATAFTLGEKYFITFDAPTENAKVIEINAANFPGTYYVTGDTYARSEVTGEDEFFQFIIQKAKVSAENTITLEAEGDPSVFSMNLRVLRPSDGQMMKLVKYDLEAPTE